MKIQTDGSKTRTIKFNGIVSELFLKIKLNPKLYLAVRKNELLTDDVLLNDNDEIQLLKIISGG